MGRNQDIDNRTGRRRIPVFVYADKAGAGSHCHNLTSRTRAILPGADAAVRNRQSTGRRQ